MASGIAVAEFIKAVGAILIETMDIFIDLTQINYFSLYFPENREQILAKHENHSHWPDYSIVSAPSRESQLLRLTMGYTLETHIQEFAG